MEQIIKVCTKYDSIPQTLIFLELKPIKEGFLLTEINPLRYNLTSKRVGLDGVTFAYYSRTPPAGEPKDVIKGI